MKTWITDLRDLPAPGAAGIAPAAQRRAEFTRAVVEAATSRASDAFWPSAVRCIGRVKKRACRTRVTVMRVEGTGVQWSCEACGDNGVVHGFEGSQSDLSRYATRGKLRLWGFDDESRKLLLSATTHIPELRAVVARATPHKQISQLLLVHATAAELDEMYTLVEELTDGTRSRSQGELLDGLRADLCTSIDGF